MAVTTPGLDPMRAHLHGQWEGVAPGWAAHAEYLDARGAGVAARLIELSGLAPGERVLELACGPGGVGLAAAPVVGPEGEVVLSDLASGMTAIAAARAARLGLTNVRTRELDLEAIDEPDASYDVVLCREGLMLVPEPDRAAREIRRVLRPGGRVAVAVWGPRARNPWLGLVFDAVGEQLGTPIPPPGVPGPFALDDAGRLAALLTEAGFRDVEVTEHPVPLRAGSFTEWWTRTVAVAGPLASRLVSLPEDGRRALETRLRAAVAPYRTAEGITLPGVCLTARGRREGGA